MNIDKTKDKWWEQLQYQCPMCRDYLCFRFEKETRTHYYKRCSHCGFSNKRKIETAHYKHKDGKTFLKVKGKFVEVELKNFGKFLKVVVKNPTLL